ncbi:MAG: hypothetical protein IPP46_02220 [Bacteroidetes bacterium]|nr:hypothetical protein [Bacteroidota bacterium]
MKLSECKLYLLKKGLLGWVLYLSSMSAFAQVETPVNPVGAPTTVVSPTADFATALSIKYNILDPVSGLHGIYIQPEFSPNASVEFGIGVTRKNLLFSGATDGDNNGFFSGSFNSPYWEKPNQSDIEDFFYDYDNRKAKSGWYFSVMPRLAFSSMVSAQAPFIGLKFEYRKYNWRADALLPSSELEYSGKSELKEQERQLNFLFVYGGRFSGGGFILEWYGGVGTRHFTLTKRDNGVEYNGSPAVATHGSVLSDYKKTSAMFEVGINIGYRMGGQ